MTLNSILAFAAAATAAAIAGAALLRKRRSFATWCFFAGMALLAIGSLLAGWTLSSTTPQQVLARQQLALVVRSLVPGVWLAFSLTYSRGNYREFLDRSRWSLIAAIVLPFAFAIAFRADLISIVGSPSAGEVLRVAFAPAGKALNTFVLIGIVLVLTNLEKTFQQAVGTMRWRMKFLLLGLALIFGARIYTRSQALLFSVEDLSLVGIDSGALLVGAILIGFAHLRSGLSEVDVYPSHAVLHRSVTVLLAGGYLLIVGALAQVTVWLGDFGSLPLQALVVLVGLAGLGMLLLSERLKQRLRAFVSRHFQRPQHDFRQVWTTLTSRLASERHETGVCTAAARMVSETFNALSVTIWVVDDRSERLLLGASTLKLKEEPPPAPSAFEARALLDLTQRPQPFDLERENAPWAEVLRNITARHFEEGSDRMAVPLVAGGRCLGVLIAGDRVYHLPYSVEELDLLKCMADQTAANLLNLRLGEDLMFARELEAFQAMSAFLVHDLKNSASSLNLMLKNLPRHFDDPAFREDALRGMGKAVGRINDLVVRLSSLRNKLELNLRETDLNKLIADVLAELGGLPNATLDQSLDLDAPVRADREQLKNVLTNLFLNAHEAIPPGGRIQIATGRENGHATLMVADAGCGMSRDFLQTSLFRPFKTTKKKGIGIGMFQSRMIVEAHGGRIQVESEAGAGTTFRVSLPLATESK